jgi:hypothetical protein
MFNFFDCLFVDLFSVAFERISAFLFAQFYFDAIQKVHALNYNVVYLQETFDLTPQLFALYRPPKYWYRHWLERKLKSTKLT